jgi:hypothetical protein
MKIKLSFDKTLELLNTIPHSVCIDAIKKNWLPNGNGGIKAHSICWLFCWAKTGMGSKKAKVVSRKVFDTIFGDSSFQYFDTQVEHEWARWARYQYENPGIEKQLASKLNGTFNADIEKAFSKSQGFQLDSKKRKEIELFAMKKAIEEFTNLGYEVADHSKDYSYDLLCTKGSEVLYVEVKGTQSLGGQVILTKNEVKFAELNKGKMVLYVVSDIKFNKKGNIVNNVAVNKINPWDISKGELVPLSYHYCIENNKEE